MNLTAFFRSSFTRVAALVAAVTAGVALIAFLIAYVSFASVADQQLRQLVNTDLASLAELFSADGPDGTAMRIDDRLALTPVSGAAPIYALADPEGVMLAGNLERWPEMASLDASWIETEQQLGEDRVPSAGRAVLLPEGYRLYVGRTLSSHRETLAQLRLVFTAGLLAALVFGVVGGLVAAGLVRRKVAALNAALQSVRRGLIDRRAPDDPSGDEFAALATNINAALDRIERLIASQREVNDLTAHELKSPLARIDHDLAAAPPGKAVEQARARLHELATMIDALMDISGVSAQIGDAQGFETVDLAAIVRGIVPLFADMAEEAGVSLNVEARGPAPIQGAPVQLKRLSANLIDNAVKFTPTGGTVTVRVRSGPILVVSDDGPGVPPSEREAIFSRFTRLGNTSAAGHGLGLSFVHSVARRHGLMVTVSDTRPGAPRPGATFTVKPAKL